jgi:hypothetical protein
MTQDNPVLIITEVIGKLEEHHFDPETIHEAENIAKLTGLATDIAANRLSPYDIKIVVELFLDLHSKFQTYYRTREYKKEAE